MVFEKAVNASSWSVFAETTWLKKGGFSDHAPA
jgi:hypothetical protein